MMNDIYQALFNIAQSMPGFLMAIVAHEAAHAYVAYKFGDPTAKAQGRLTLNPAAHYDPWGTIFIPVIAAFLGAVIIGWAKPVPIDVRNFKKIRSGVFWVSFAGPLANLILGVISALLFAIVATKIPVEFGYYSIFLGMLKYSIFINFILAAFNLLPLPPLDGSKMVSSFLKGEALRKYENFANFTPFLFLILMVLSFNNQLNVLGYVLMPAQQLGQSVTLFFLRLFGAF